MPNEPTPRDEWKANPYTSSIDAALALVERVLPGWSVDLHWAADGCAACVKGPLSGDGDFWSSGRVPGARAIIAALLRALASTPQGETI